MERLISNHPDALTLHRPQQLLPVELTLAGCYPQPSTTPVYDAQK